jgi:hypothetical protein
MSLAKKPKTKIPNFSKYCVIYVAISYTTMKHRYIESNPASVQQWRNEHVQLKTGDDTMALEVVGTEKNLTNVSRSLGFLWTRNTHRCIDSMYVLQQFLVLTTLATRIHGKIMT